MAMVPKMDQIPNIPKTGNGKLMMIFKKSTLFPPKKLALLSKKMTTLYVLIEKQQKYFCNSFFYLEYNDSIFVWFSKNSIPPTQQIYFNDLPSSNQFQALSTDPMKSSLVIVWK